MHQPMVATAYNSWIRFILVKNIVLITCHDEILHLKIYKTWKKNLEKNKLKVEIGHGK